MNEHKGHDGFSLIELLIVVVIIGILAAIAIPNLLASRRAANEGSAISSLRTINTCEATYRATSGGGDFGDLTALRAQTLTDQVLGSGTKSGYSFVVTPTDPGVRPSLYYATATPIVISGFGQSGTRRFGVSEDGVIHGDPSMTAYVDENDVRAAPNLGSY